MASQYETGFYVNGGHYDGQQFIGMDIDEALENIQSDYSIQKLVHDYVYAAWEIDRESIAHDIAYEGLLDQTLESIAWNALDHIIENTNEGCGPVYGNVYWWESGWGDSPQPPPEIWGLSVSNAKKTANRRPAGKTVKAKPKARMPAKKAPAKKPANRRR